MSEKEKKSASCDGSTGVMIEQSSELRHKKQSHQNQENQKDSTPGTHHKRSRTSAAPSVAETLNDSGKYSESKEQIEMMSSEYQKHNVTKKKSSSTKILDVSSSEALPNVEIKAGGLVCKSKHTDGSEASTPATVLSAVAPMLATTSLSLASPLSTTVAPIPSSKTATTTSAKVLLPVTTKVPSCIPKAASVLPATVSLATPTKVSPVLSTPVAPVHGTIVVSPLTASAPPLQEETIIQKITSTQKVDPSESITQQKKASPDPDPAPSKGQPQKLSSHLVQPIPQPKNIEDEITIDKSERKSDEESVIEDIAELRSPEASKKLTSWSDDEEAGGLSRTDSRGSRMTRAVRQLFCCGQPLDAPSEDEISYARDHLGGGV